MTGLRWVYDGPGRFRLWNKLRSVFIARIEHATPMLRGAESRWLAFVGDAVVARDCAGFDEAMVKVGQALADR